MKRFNKCGVAAALLATSALVSTIALAQESSTQPPIMKDAGKAKGSTETKPSAKGDAPVQIQQSRDSQAASGAAPGEQQQPGEAETAKEAAPGQVKRDSTPGSAEAEGTGTSEQPPNATTKTATETTPGQTEQNQASEDKPSTETTGSIDISSEQKVEIRNAIRQADVKPIDVDFEVNVGVAVPTTVELRPLPPRIIEIVPDYRGYEYFVLADGRIIIVEPDSHRIVYVLVV
ncbi:DUF1236 domain-containing protein [Kumtagia ephedrae]|uniref:DUF1236 domain-containing protein n=1 Tax=Kumtagia ephedrae TaxID=2116701 RepID=A0A2P7S0Z5_9HYPH|nr:DUF1236 domain-containing protein [Mesorhizobium ephedrae]PSJ56141.1 hypothetical protein C7I84_21460 [Mesorhizobium ephedrae]